MLNNVESGASLNSFSVTLPSYAWDKVVNFVLLFKVHSHQNNTNTCTMCVLHISMPLSFLLVPCAIICMSMWQCKKVYRGRIGWEALALRPFSLSFLSSFVTHSSIRIFIHSLLLHFIHWPHPIPGALMKLSRSQRVLNTRTHATNNWEQHKTKRWPTEQGE